VTDDGLILFREAQTMTRREARFALMDPATGEKEWLPDSPGAGNQSWAVELSTERLVLMRFETSDDASSPTGMARRPVLDVYDRAAAAWRTIGWPTLPANDSPSFVQIGPDGRAYVALVSDPGNVPEGGWPMGPDGEADDSDAEGEVRALWSMSLTEPADARDEGMQVGAFAFDDDDRLVWTDSTNGAAGRVHVRDLDSGEETSFDPGLGERCNLLGFDVAGGRIAMSQYCGTYDDGVRDDRVQVVTTEGEPVITVQDSGAEGGDLGRRGRLPHGDGVRPRDGRHVRLRLREGEAAASQRGALPVVGGPGPDTWRPPHVDHAGGLEAPRVRPQRGHRPPRRADPLTRRTC
jgi:hypothetical protein